MILTTWLILSLALPLSASEALPTLRDLALLVDPQGTETITSIDLFPPDQSHRPRSPPPPLARPAGGYRSNHSYRHALASAPPCAILGDASLPRTILGNLLEDAEKATSLVVISMIETVLRDIPLRGS